MNKLIIILLSSACCISASAAVPVTWAVDVANMTSKDVTAYRGETLDLAVTFAGYRPSVATATLYWQTNGMDNAWWSTNATYSAGVARATFTPAMDPGASTVLFFIAVNDPGGTCYRASGRLRLSRSPGSNPASAPLPPPGGTIDFSRITVLNAPWATLEAAQSAVSTGVNQALNAVASESNRAERTYAKLSDIPAVPSIAGLATTGEVAAASAAAQAAAEQSAASTYQPLSGMADYARLSDIPAVPSIAGLATTGEVAAAAAAAQAAAESTAASTYQPLSGMADYAKLSDIPAVPSIAGLATTGEVAAAAAAAQAAAESTAASTYQPLSGMADYARLSDIPSVPSIAGLATTGEVAAAAAAAQAAAESTAASTYQPLSAMADYPQRHEVPTVNLSGRDLTVNGNTVNIPLPGESGSVISDGTNAIDAAGNTYTNGVKSSKLRARDDRIWGDYGYSEPEASEPGVTVNEINFIFPGNTQIQFSYDNHSWVQYVTYEIDENDWTSITGIGPGARNESMLDWDYDFSFDVTRRPLFDRFALESQLPGSGSNLDTNTVAEIANHAIATNATVSGKLSMTNETGTAWVGWNDSIFNFSYGINVQASPCSFPAELDGFYFGDRTMKSLLDEKADVTDLETAISTNNPAFVSAVLETGLNIDTNDVAVIKAFVDDWPVDPATGATTLGGLLAALAAAIALLKKNKLEKGLTNGVPTDANVAELFSKSDTSQYPSTVAGALKNAVLEKSIVLAVTSNFADADNTSYGSAE